MRDAAERQHGNAYGADYLLQQSQTQRRAEGFFGCRCEHGTEDGEVGSFGVRLLYLRDRVAGDADQKTLWGDGAEKPWRD